MATTVKRDRSESMVTISGVDPAMRLEVERLARAETRTRSAQIRQLMLEALERRGWKPSPEDQQ